MSNVSMTPVTSESVAEIGYDAENQELHVLFNSGSLYVYHQVGQETYEEFMAADSKGTYLNAHIKNVFSYSKMS